MTDVNQTPHPIPPKGYIKPLLFSMLTLASGVIIGAAATAMILHKPVVPPQTGGGLEWITERIVNGLVRELSLTPEQKEKAYPIVREHFENITKIRDGVREQIQKEIEGMNDELLAVFDESQKQSYQDNIQRMGERFPGIGRRRGGPGGPGQRGSGQRGPGSGQRGSGQRGPGSGQRGLVPGQPGLVPGQPGMIPGQNPWLTMPGIGDSNSPGMDMGGFRRDGRRRQRPPIDPNLFPPTMPFNTNPFTPPNQE